MAYNNTFSSPFSALAPKTNKPKQTASSIMSTLTGPIGMSKMPSSGLVQAPTNAQTQSSNAAGTSGVVKSSATTGNPIIIPKSESQIAYEKSITDAIPYGQPNSTATAPTTTSTGAPINYVPITAPASQIVSEKSTLSPANDVISQPGTTGIFPSVLSSLIGKSVAPSGVYTAGINKYNELSATAADIAQREANAKIGYLSSGFTPEAMGAASLTQANTSERLNALGLQQQAALTAAGAGQTQQQIEQAGLGTAAGLAQPSPAAYGQTVFNPATGQYENQGTGGGDFQTSLDTYAKGMADNSITPSQIPASVSSNPVLFAQLLQKAQQLNPSFNATQWQANIQAQQTALQQNATTGLTMQRSAQSANQALDALQTAYNGLGALTGGTNIPILNQLEQSVAMASGLGREKVSAFQGALKEARAQINTVLAPLIGVDSANATSNSLLPDNMTPGEIPQKIQAARDYVKQRVEAFTTTGGVPQYGQTTNQTTGSNLFSW